MVKLIAIAVGCITAVFFLVKLMSIIMHALIIIGAIALIVVVVLALFKKLDILTSIFPKG